MVGMMLEREVRSCEIVKVFIFSVIGKLLGGF